VPHNKKHDNIPDLLSSKKSPITESMAAARK